MSRMIAVFVGPESAEAILQNVEGDANDQNIGDAFREMYGDSLESLDQEVTPITDDIFVCWREGSNRYQGKVFAGYMGFERDFVQEDSLHFVVFVD